MCLSLNKLVGNSWPIVDTGAISFPDSFRPAVSDSAANSLGKYRRHYHA
jgi:hypothetical protein